MSGGGGGKSVQSTEPWKGQKQPLLDLYQDADGVFRQRETPAQYGELSGDARLDFVRDTTGIDGRSAEGLAALGLDPGTTGTAISSGGFVPFTAAEQEAQQGAFDLARSGVNPYLLQAEADLAENAGLDYLDDGASGTYLTHDSNPYLADAVAAAQDPLIERFQADILPAVTGQFGKSGNFGSSAHQYAIQRATDDFTRNLTDAATNVYLSNYTTERGNQLAAQQALTEGIQRNATLAPTLASASRGEALNNLRLLEGVGGAQAAKAAELGTMRADDFNFRANDDVNRLRDYASIIQGGPMLTSQSSKGGGTNRTAGALGGAASGAAMGTAIMPGWGTAAGAVIGGLGGLFL